MTRTRKAYLAMGMAVAEALLSATLASAQVAAGSDGRAMDANNRVGSGGYNSSGGYSAYIGVTPNQIVYGNVTGGKEFRGPVGSRDPGAFSGPSPGRMVDRFVSGSAGVPYAYQPQVDLSTAQPFYGMSRNAPPPVGSVRLGYTGSYVGTNLVPYTDYGLNAQYAPASDDLLTQRLGVSQVLGTRSTLVGTSNVGELYMQPVNGPDNDNSGFSGSALYGVQPLRTSFDDSSNTNQTNGLMAGPGDRFRFDSADIRRMRGELESPDQRQQQNGQNNQNNQNGQQGLVQPLNGLDSTPQTNSLGFSSDMQTGQATQQRYTIVSPDLQSSQYRQMRERLAQYENPQYTQLEAQHRARMDRQAIAKKMDAASSQPANVVIGVNPDAIAAAGIKQPTDSAIKAEPIKVTSLATGVRAKGLHDMLAQGEDFMRQGKFQTAIDRYDVALQIAPNNPLVSLGRANAELGAGAYRLATSDLRRIFSNDHATLVAQYDLKAWFPAARLEAITKELSDLAARDPKDEMPEFLLTYIAYNTGDPENAARHLTEARKRSTAPDPLLDFMERDWKLPVVEHVPPIQPDLNK